MSLQKGIDQFIEDIQLRKKDRVVRTVTSIFRQLPNIIIIGAQKSGTTSLFNYLEQHPQIVGSKPKEVHYFDINYEYGTLWYRSHFPLKSNSLALEASPYYICHPHAPKRIYNLLPNVRLIAILRNPVERAISHYFHQVRTRSEKLPIFDALKYEEVRLKTSWKNMVADEMYNNRNHQRFSYKQRGVYIEQLERFWKFFDSRNLFIINSEKLFTEPFNTLNEIFSFLEVDSNVKDIDLKKYTVGVNRKKVSREVYDYLTEYFKPFNERLYERIGEDFGW